MLEWFCNISEWTERHAGLGGWVGAIGAVLAIFVTWFLARREYLRTIRQDAKRRRAEIDLLTRIVREFENLVTRYKKLGQDGPGAGEFFNTHGNDPEWLSMADLVFLPVTRWPSLEAYAAFKRYWFASLEFMKMAGITNVDRKEQYARWERAHDEAFP